MQVTNPTYHGAYLDGRSYADEQWDPDEDWDEQIERLAKKVLAGQSLRTLVGQVVTEAYKNRFDEWEKECSGLFLDENAKSYKEAGLDPEKAFAEWIRGYHDREQMLLEEAVVEEIEEIVSEEEDEGFEDEDPDDAEGDDEEEENEAEPTAAPADKKSARGKK